MKTNINIEKPDWELTGKYLTGEASPEEIRKVEEWAAASKNNREELEQCQHLLLQADNHYRIKQFDTGNAWKNIREKMRPAPSVIPFASSGKKLVVWYYKYAAAILIAALLGIMGYYISREKPDNHLLTEIVSAEKQVLDEYTLSDGSVVTLNSNSKLSFPEKFSDKVREVTITGEAFFDITPDSRRPFIINAGNARIKVLGTSFNVNAYPESESVEVTVESGIVEVTLKERINPGEKEGLILNPGELGIASNTGRKLVKSANSNLNYLAWKTQNLVFVETRLEEVVQLLNKTYHADIKLQNSDLENLLLTAEFEKKPVEFILEVICLTFDIEFKKENTTYILSDNSASH